MIVDTSVLLAYFNRSEPDHAAAARYGTRTVATLDRRHFEVLRPLGGGRFTIVP